MSTRILSGQNNNEGYANSSFAGSNNNSRKDVMSNLTVAQVRELYARALSEAEAKRTELKIVVTSRYKELVGSSDDVQTMQLCAKELYENVFSLSTLLEKVNTANEEALQVARKLPSTMISSAPTKGSNSNAKTLAQFIQQKAQTEPNLVMYLRKRLEVLTRRIHRALDKKDPHLAALALAEAMSWIAIQDYAANISTSSTASGILYPLASVISLVDPQKFCQFLLPPNQEEGKDDSPQLRQQRLEQYSLLVIQTRLTFLRIQCLPLKTIRLAQMVLKTPDTNVDEKAGSLFTLPLLDPTFRASDTSATKLLDLYYDSKSNLLSNLLDTLEENHGIASTKTRNNSLDDDDDNNSVLHNLVQQLQTIVLVLQQDLILHSHKVFLQLLSSSYNMYSKQPIGNKSLSDGTTGSSSSSSADISNVAPGGVEIDFDPKMVKAKCSRFLAAHLPMIANRLRSILSSVNTATHLATIRQVLYQQTNTDLDHDQWNEAVQGIVDLRIVLHAKNSGDESTANTLMLSAAATTTAARSWATLSDGQPSLSFSLWSILFSQTFDSLVENLLRQSCMSLHNTLISTLRRSIALAPSPSHRIKPHEAYRNCLTIVSTLDATFARLADDAWKLVHSEERHVSSVALRQSLYTQTCEAMARLLCDLRLLVDESSTNNPNSRKGVSSSTGDTDKFSDNNKEQQHQQEVNESSNGCNDGVKELIVARLCFLLKYRLKSLQTLLNPSSAPWYDSVSVSRQHMITFEELQSAFEIADDDDDGILSLTEASEALETAFSGSNFDAIHVISSLRHEMDPSNVSTNVTLPELTLLTARGIKYEPAPSMSAREKNQQLTTKSSSEKNYALQTIQTCLDSITVSCWKSWAKIVLAPAARELSIGCGLFCQNWHVSESEWFRLHEGGESPGTSGAYLPSSVSPHIMAFLLSVSMEFHRVICPRDFLSPVDTVEEAEELGINISSAKVGRELPPTLVVLIRQALLSHALTTFHNVLMSANIGSSSAMQQCSNPCLLQIMVDVKFFLYCMDRCAALLLDHQSTELMKRLQGIVVDAAVCLDPRMNVDSIREKVDTMLCPSILSSCVLFLDSLLGQDSRVQSSKISDVFLGLSSSLGDAGQTSDFRFASTLTPLVSSRRFALLPIQSERQLNEIALQASRNANPKFEKSDFASKSGGATSGFGFFTSMKAWKK